MHAPHRHALTHTAARVRAQVRAGCDLKSEKRGALEVGTVVHVLATDGFRATVCYSAQWYGHGYSGKAMAFFIYSKLFELFDTLWLILKKRPVIFKEEPHKNSMPTNVEASQQSSELPTNCCCPPNHP